MEASNVRMERAAVDFRPMLQIMLSDYLVELATMEGVGVQRDENGYVGYCWLDAYWQEPERIPFVIRKEQDVAGFCLLRDVGTRWHVAEFFVLPVYRRRGVGTAAVEKLKALCRSYGRYRYLEAPTHWWNWVGTSFWRCQGFVTVAQDDELLVNLCDL